MKAELIFANQRSRQQSYFTIQFIAHSKSAYAPNSNKKVKENISEV